MELQLPGERDTAKLAHDASQWWQEQAEKAGVDLTSFDLAASLAERMDWARGIGLDVATVYACSNRRHPQPVADQVWECTTFAATNRLYVPPELVSTDEGVSGHRSGLTRLKAILDGQHATVLLVSSISPTVPPEPAGLRVHRGEGGPDGPAGHQRPRGH